MARVSGQGFVGACILMLVTVAVASGQGVKVRARTAPRGDFLCYGVRQGRSLLQGRLARFPRGIG